MERSTRRLIPLLLLIPTLARAEIELDRLTSCEELGNIRSSLHTESLPQQCRNAASPLENLILEKTGELSKSLCILEETPSPMLNGFTCFVDFKHLGHSLFCVKPVQASEIYNYQENYKNQYSQKVIDYLIQISKCPVSNGSATQASLSNTPYLAATISKFQFGFISPLGTGIKTSDYVQQGYATIDKNLNINSDAIEYVNFLIDGKYPEKEKFITIGEWMLNIDHSEDADNILNQEFKRNSAPIKATGTSYTLKNVSTEQSDDSKLQTLDTLINSIANTLKDEGFKDKTKESMPPGGMKELIKRVKDSTPPGLADISKQKIGENVRFLINTTTQTCTKNNSGAIAFTIASIEPNPEVSSSFGSINLVAMSLGKCANSRPVQKYIDALIKQLDDSIKNELQSM